MIVMPYCFFFLQKLAAFGNDSRVLEKKTEGRTINKTLNETIQIAPMVTI